MPQKIACLGTYLPRRCGIATFTHDLYHSIKSNLDPGSEISVIAMDDGHSPIDYPSEVQFIINQHDVESYERAAEYLNLKKFDALFLQHEYGIFGGNHGISIFNLLRKLENTQVFTTLHTVLHNPSAEQRGVIEKLSLFSKKIIVMNESAKGILQKNYLLDTRKIAVIPHGVPDVELSGSEDFKCKYNLVGKKVILTFGLLSPGKGIEYMIEALPEIVKEHPDVIYIYLGVTHPGIIRENKEDYRDSLLNLAKKLSVENNILFLDQFVHLPELVEYLKLCDIYVTPYLNKEQISSGTLSYAISTGKAVVSTPYYCAEELLGEDRGVLVPFKNSAAIAVAVNKILDNPEFFASLRRNAYEYGRRMLWSHVGEAHLKLIIKNKIIPLKNKFEIPVPNLNHMISITDSTGILQHAHHNIPNRFHGYCTDDNARAFFATLVYMENYKDEKKIKLLKTYLSFIFHSFNFDNKRFRNFMSYDREWLETTGSEDSHGRTLYALGYGLKSIKDLKVYRIVEDLFREAAKTPLQFEHPRAWAYSLIGLSFFLEVFPKDEEIRSIHRVLLQNLLNKVKQNLKPDWLWFESRLTYSNAIIPQALIRAGEVSHDVQASELGIKMLEWLFKLQTDPTHQHLSLIGNDGWLQNGQKKALFDQQPIEAFELLDGAYAALTISKNKIWVEKIKMCLEWFLGNNDSGQILYETESGGTFDGLQVLGVNQNQGAESCLAGLLSVTISRKVLAQEILHHEKKQYFSESTYLVQ